MADQKQVIGSGSGLSEKRQRVFDKIAKNDLNGFSLLVADLEEGVNFVDDNGMSPLQHACCKGNKEAVRILLDAGADVNYNLHGANYTPLHFAAISGNVNVCRMLLDAGIDPNSVNSVSRTASQMAAFVGNHACVETINNYVSRAQLECCTRPQNCQNEPLIPPTLLDSLHEFVVEINLHPVRIALNIVSLNLLKYLPELRKAMELLCAKEMKKLNDVNEIMAFKFHYLGWIVSEIIRCKELCKAQRDAEAAETEEDPAKHDFIEFFIKRVLKENKQRQLDYIEFTVRECVREFPFRECTIFRLIVTQLASKDAPPALSVLRHAINGQRGFLDATTFCSTCGNEKPDKKCSKCKSVQYCGRECQRLHWFMHKKSCSRPSPTTSNPRTPALPDARELQQELAKLQLT